VVIISVLFARRDARFGTRHIVAGQYLGFAALVAISFAAAAGLVALPDEAVGLMGLVPLALGAHGLLRARRDDGDELRDRPPGTLGVAAITVANGADNVAVYAPLFATFGLGDAAVCIAVFAAGVLALCALGAVVGTRPAVERAGAYAIPVVFIALGVFIVVESGLVT
jgi:cadmium resistance protein CadD (predicted permease)